jgi:hypothetical protein
MRVNRYSWWTHWRALADYYLPRRYKWLITPNQQNRGSPINQHIVDSTGYLCAQNLASGLMSGKTSPIQPWFGLTAGREDSTGTTPVSLWLGQVERLLRAIFSESNFYPCMHQYFMDLVIMGTAVMLIYEDFDDVICCRNPCAGEYYVDIDQRYRPTILGLEYVQTIRQVVKEFGYENCSSSVQRSYDLPNGAGLTREIILAQLIEPNDDSRGFSVSKRFPFRECIFEWGGSASPQNNSGDNRGFLRRGGYYEQPNITSRWYLVSNDPYGRSPAMDALGDQKQLQLEQRRKAQAIDKMINPPLVADIQLKNKPASLLPGGITYVTGFAQSGKPGLASIYNSQFPIHDVVEDLVEVRERISRTFFNQLFQPMSQFQTRSNVTAVEVEQRRAEALLMLGPVFERLDQEALRPTIERTYAIAKRAGIIPPPPPEIAGKDIAVKFVSMLKLAQDSTDATAIQEVLAMAGQLAGVDPQIMDDVDTGTAINLYSKLRGNDPRIMRTPDAVAAIRQQRAQQQQAAQQADIAQKLSAGAGNLASAGMIPGVQGRVPQGGQTGA